MIDFHSHILPKLDDGSQSVEESLTLLRMLEEQGVTKVAATPHFSANRESVENFLARREKAYQTLIHSSPIAVPQIYMGAEVKYYEGIQKLKDLEKLEIQGTHLLLLEMPFSKWSSFAFRELIDLANMENITILLAHIERYKHCVTHEQLNTLRNYGILIQSNASYFLNFKTKRKAFQMLKNHEVHVLGSDCHNLSHRPPKIGMAQDAIIKKFGIEEYKKWNESCESLFEFKKVPVSL